MYETVYLGSGNRSLLQFTLGSAVHNLNAETRFIALVGDTFIGSNSDPDFFDWVTDPTKLAVELGQLAVSPGVHEVEIRSFNANVSPYFCWGKRLMLFV